MLNIVENSNDNSLTILQHSAQVFHDALALVKQGETRFHVSHDGGEDYDLQYTKNMDLFDPQVKSVILTMTSGKDLHPEFLSYDENDKESICLEFLELFNRAEFECLDEYTIAIAKVILTFTGMPVYFLDSRIHWFIPACDRLFVVESFPEKKPKETFRVTPSPVELGMPKNDWSYVSTVIAFQNIFFWQEMMAGKTQPVKYAEVVIARLTGIGGILAHLSDFSRFLGEKNWSVYLSPGCTRYPDDVLTRYFRIQAKPADATPENTVMIDNYGFYSITWYFNQEKANVDETMLNEKFAADMTEYAEAVLAGKKTLGILARGTDYTVMNMGDSKIHATVAQMIPVIRKWLKEDIYEQIFLGTEDKDILDAMRSAFPGIVRAVSQKRHTTSELEETGTQILADLEEKLYSGKEYEELLEDTTVNYFYALFVLSKCDAFMASGECNGVDVVKSFNHGKFEKEYTFTVGLTGEPGTENWEALRPIFAGVFARGSYPERKAFYMTNAFTLDDPVSDEAVRLAWKKTMWVYPYFTRAVVKRNRVYYLADNPLEFVIADTEKILEPGTAEGNYHAVTICYHDRKLNFYIDHVPTDGTGWRMVLETFFYYYYCALDGVEYPVPDGVRTIEDGVPADQETDAYLMRDAIDPQGMMKFDPREMFQYPETPEGDVKLEDCGHYVIRVPSRELMGYARTVGGSPSSVLLQLVGQSFQRLIPENTLPYNFFTPVSVRKVMGNTNSLLHQVVHNLYACDAEVLSDDARAREFNEGFRGQLKAFASPASIPMLCGVYRGIVEGYQKAIGANMLDRIMQGGAGPQISVGASFIGTIAAGDYGRRIHMDVFRVMPQKMCMAYMMEVGDEFYISYTLGAKTDRYVRDMTEHMHELGMSHAECEEV